MGVRHGCPQFSILSPTAFHIPRFCLSRVPCSHCSLLTSASTLQLPNQAIIELIDITKSSKSSARGREGADSKSDLDSHIYQITASSLTFLAMAEAIPLVDALSVVDKKAGGLLLVGPEGDFTDKEVEALTKAGAIPVGLGPHRLRVETATITLLAGAMLWTDHDVL